MNALKVALDYRARGLSVVPIKPGDKIPSVGWKPYQEGLATKEEIEGWYKSLPDAGVGIICGKVSGMLVVLDIDPRNKGLESIRGRALPATPTVRTGGGGWHYYFRSDRAIQKRQILPGVDLQAEGALVVAPPSIHRSGERYAFCEGMGLDDLLLAPVPDWVLELTRPVGLVGSPTPHKAPGIDSCLQRVAEGGRNSALTKLVGKLLGKKLPVDEVRQIAANTNATYIPPLSDSEVASVIDSLCKKEAEKSPGSSVQMTAGFDGLVDVVEENGEPVFLIRAEDGSPRVLKEKRGNDGKVYLPPTREHLPWTLPRAPEVLRYCGETASRTIQSIDAELFRDLAEYHKKVSELPGEGYYRLLATFDLHTYLMESFQYSPILCFYAVPERGKSRTGKAITYVAFRGIHVESLRDPYIIRAATDLRATIFFDVLALWKKAQAAGSEDVLLQRFERGSRVPRVNFPERGAFRDTVYYDIFGPSLIATNEPLNHILETRCIPIQMPDSQRRYEDDITPAAALPLRERLVAFRWRHLGGALPSVEKPTRGRLGDIMKPLRQMVCLVSPYDEPDFMKLVGEIERGRTLEKSEGWDAQIIQSVYLQRDKVKNGILAAEDVRAVFNIGKSEREHWTSHRIAKALAGLGFRKTTTGNGCSAIVYETAQVDRLRAAYGLQATSVTPVSSESGVLPGVTGLTDVAGGM